MNEGVRKLMQLRRDDEREEEEDRDPDGQRIFDADRALRGGADQIRTPGFPAVYITRSNACRFCVGLL